jgi:hypothetical protein
VVLDREGRNLKFFILNLARLFSFKLLLFHFLLGRKRVKGGG